MSSRRQEPRDYHAQGRPGKIQGPPTKPFKTQRDGDVKPERQRRGEWGVVRDGAVRDYGPSHAPLTGGEAAGWRACGTAPPPSGGRPPPATARAAGST